SPGQNRRFIVNKGRKFARKSRFPDAGGPENRHEMTTLSPPHPVERFTQTCDLGRSPDEWRAELAFNWIRLGIERNDLPGSGRRRRTEFDGAPNQATRCVADDDLVEVSGVLELHETAWHLVIEQSIVRREGLCR